MIELSSQNKGIFITGTDTNVGKTVVSSLITAAMRLQGMNTGYFKPVQTGTDLDCDTVRALSGLSDEWIERPVYAFSEPIAPYRAALLHQLPISLEKIQNHWNELPKRNWVVEGAGGLLVPLSQRKTIRELIGVLKLPTIVVASTRLGTINHSLLSIESASRAGLRVLGIVLVGYEDPGLAELLHSLTGVPIIAQIPQLPELTRFEIDAAALEKFPIHILQSWFQNE